MSSGFFPIFRSLDDNDFWPELPWTYQEVFRTVLKECCYRATQFMDHGVIIDLKPGQFCTSIRDLQKKCHRDVSKNHVERGLAELEKIGFLRQEVRHRKTIITVTYPEACEWFKSGNETGNETILRQFRDNLETQKNKYNKYNIYNIPPIVPQSSVPSNELSQPAVAAAATASPRNSSSDFSLHREKEAHKIVEMDFLNPDPQEDTTQSVIIGNKPQSDNICFVANEQIKKTNKSEIVEVLNKETVKVDKKDPSAEAVALLEFFKTSMTKQDIDTTREIKKDQAVIFDKLLKKKSLQEIQSVINHAHSGWWKANAPILNPKKLEEKFDTLWNQLKALASSSSGNRENYIDLIKKHYKNGEIYNGAHFFIDDSAATLHRGSHVKSVKLKENGFKDQFENMLRAFQLPIPK